MGVAKILIPDSPLAGSGGVGLTSSGSAARWQVLQTLPRQEKKLAEDLSALGIDYFLPLFTQTKSYGRRKISTQLPLFPGYLFLRGTLDDAYLADRTRRVARRIAVANQQHLEWELGNIRKALQGQARFDPYPYLVAGIRVEVKSGPFEGLQGVIEQRLGSNRLILQVDLLGSAVSMEIDAALLEPVESVPLRRSA